MEISLDILGWSFVLLSFNLIIALLAQNPAVFFITVFIEIIFGLAYAMYLIQQITRPPPGAIRYSKCYKGRH
jgi:hypothetical protein